LYYDSNGIIYCVTEYSKKLKDETIAFYGDSITHRNGYLSHLTLLYATRYPLTPVNIFNAGVGGNRLSTAFMRFKHDVIDQNPTVVVSMFGMNDGNYRFFDTSAFDIYQKNIETLVNRIKVETGAHLILCTPSQFDPQTLASEHLAEKSQLYNKTLMLYGDYLKSLGFRLGIPVIDMNREMVNIFSCLRKSYPNIDFHEDAIHPNDLGYWFMFLTLAKEFGVASMVSAISVNLKENSVNKIRCSVSSLKQEHDAISFSLLEESLPFPYPPYLDIAKKFTDFQGALNSEVLQIVDLPEGRYRLVIDKTEIGTYSSVDFFKGVDIGDISSTPQYCQALEGAKINSKLQEKVLQFRNFRLMEKGKGYLQEGGTYPQKITKVVAKPDGTMVSEPDEDAERKFADKAKEIPAVLAEITRLREELYRQCKPVVHHYIIEPVRK